MDHHVLPHLNAILNGTSGLLLATGFAMVRLGRIRAHKACMLGALTASVLFLISYLVYHSQAGSVRFTGQGWVRPLYFTILVSHSVLAAMIVPLAIVTVRRALRERFEAHVRIARLTLPVWLYVSVTGIVVYWMLYRL